MERGLHFGNVSISLVLLLPLLLLLLLGVLLGPGASGGQVQGSGSVRRETPPQSVGRLTAALASHRDVAKRGGMKRGGSEDVDVPDAAAPVIGGDVTVEDDNSNGGNDPPGETDNLYRERNENVAAPSRYLVTAAAVLLFRLTPWS